MWLDDNTRRRTKQQILLEDFDFWWTDRDLAGPQLGGHPLRQLRSLRSVIGPPLGTGRGALLTTHRMATAAASSRIYALAGSPQAVNSRPDNDGIDGGR